MPTLSQYWFQNQLLSGPFDVLNQPYSEGSWAWIGTGGQSEGSLAWTRPDGEIAVPIAAQLNTAAALAAIDAQLQSPASRSSGIKASLKFWWQVPYESQDPSRHGNWDMLVQVYFDFHVDTPWYCSDADGTISYYLVVFLDGNGHLKASVDGWWYSYNGGGPFCTGAINDALNSAGAAGIAPLQNLLDTNLGALSGLTFSTIYLLPGSGTNAPGNTNENADDDAAIALLP